jgi:hypothetical protein
MQSRTLCAVLWAAGCIFTPAGHSDEVLKWVDANGVTHFGDRVTAPDGGARIIEVQQANGMVAPDTSVLNRKQAMAQTLTLERASVTNKRGWRGYESSGHTKRGNRR